MGSSSVLLFRLCAHRTPLILSVQFRWNAALAFASYIDSNPEIACNRCVLELGAGGGLPGLVAAQNGAKKV
jgi:nicotinamide N-methyltransferase